MLNDFLHVKKEKGIFFSATFICSLFVLFLLLSPGKALAISKSVTVLISPENPNAGEKVHISLESFSLDLNRANISWYLNGKLVNSGTGNAKFDVIAGKVGEATNIDITIISNEGDVIKRTFTIRPEELDVLWEASDSYVPPFYQGKALLSSEGTLTFAALPNIKTSSGIYLKPSEFIYSWKHGYTFDQAGSGSGEYVYQVHNSYLNSGESVTVSATSNNGIYSASRDLFVPLVQPSLLFYESHPLSGVDYSRVLMGSAPVNKDEMTIVAEPYYIGPRTLKSAALAFTWKLNGNTTPTPLDPNKLVVRKSPGQKGNAIVSVTVRNIFKLFGEVTGSLAVTF